MMDSPEAAIQTGAAGQQMVGLIGDLYPICRSITGDGVRQTLDLIGRHIPLTIHEVATGTKVFDWTVPKEWNIRDAYVKNAAGERVIDFNDSNLHVVSYSVPVRRRMSLDELKKHLFVHDSNDEWIPYRTSYYNETWGFCLSAERLASLAEGAYEVVIDSSLEDGSLTYAEYFKQGKRDEEILLSCHICHPSLCNDNLSGIALLTFLATYLETQSTSYSYRLLFIPGTIGAITWLSQNEAVCNRIRHGLVVSCVGDPGAFTYKRSRQGSARIDRVVERALSASDSPFSVEDFSPYGYDERQFGSPGFDLPIGRFTRSANGAYPEYHSSADNLDLVTPEALGESLRMFVRVIGMLETEKVYLNTNPKCEPQLGRRNLYGVQGDDGTDLTLAMLWMLNQSDGQHSLVDIAEKSGLPAKDLERAAEILSKNGLLIEA